MTTDGEDPVTVDLVVVGAHLSGGPLMHQLVDRAGVLVGPVRTAPIYRLVALSGAVAKPGLVRVGAGGGAVVGERWRLPVEGFGAFVAGVPSPLAIGTVVLDDGDEVHGFLCESWAAEGAPDITAHGGWLAHLAAEQA